jgi:hypothetical protein
VKFSPLKSLALMVGCLSIPCLHRTMPALVPLPVLPPLPESPDNPIGEVVTIPPRDFDAERIEEAETRRRLKAEKKARNIAKARGIDYSIGS